MTGNSQDDYAKMMLGGGRPIEGNRSRSGKNAPSKYLSAAAAKKRAAAKPKSQSKSKSKKRK
jgi:hypothetical protein